MVNTNWFILFINLILKCHDKYPLNYSLGYLWSRLSNVSEVDILTVVQDAERRIIISKIEQNFNFEHWLLLFMKYYEFGCLHVSIFATFCGKEFTYSMNVQICVWQCTFLVLILKQFFLVCSKTAKMSAELTKILSDFRSYWLYLVIYGRWYVQYFGERNPYSVRKLTFIAVKNAVKWSARVLKSEARIKVKVKTMIMGIVLS